jgi:hypothetical protein
MFFRRKDNMNVGGKIPEMSISGKLARIFVSKEWPGRRNHECLPSADMSVGVLSGQTARASLSARHYLQIHA